MPTLDLHWFADRFDERLREIQAIVRGLPRDVDPEARARLVRAVGRAMGTAEGFRIHADAVRRVAPEMFHADVAPPVPAEAATALDAALMGTPGQEYREDYYDGEDDDEDPDLCPGCGELYEHCDCNDDPDDDDLDEWEDAEDDDEDPDLDDSEALRREAMGPVDGPRIAAVAGPAEDDDIPFPDSFPHQHAPRLVRAEVAG